MATDTTLVPETSESYLRQIFIRAQMADFVRDPFLVARADGVHGNDVGNVVQQFIDKVFRATSIEVVLNDKQRLYITGPGSLAQFV